MVIVNLCGGLGNQLFQYACGRAVAAANGMRLKLDVSAFPDKNGRLYELDSFAISATHAGRLDCSVARYGLGRALLLYVLARSRVTRYRPARASSWYREKAICHCDAEVFNCGSRVYLSGYWQCYGYADRVRDVLLEELKVRQPPDDRNGAILERIGANESVAVHVRRGDYVSNAGENAHLGSCGVSYYRDAMASLEASLDSPRFYVFSDDPGWVRENLHDGKRCLEVIDHNSGPKAGIEDFRLMRACKHFVVANSTFSWWAAWLGAAPGKKVIAPYPWFADENRSDDELVPPEWERVPRAVSRSES